MIGLIKLIHVRNDVLITEANASAHSTAGSTPRAMTVDPIKLRAISRMGGITYGRVGAGFEIPRPAWEHVKDDYEAAVKAKEQV